MVLFSQDLKASERKDTSITVYGNCKSCKKTIEKTVLGIKGVDKAEWDKSSKKLTLTFDLAVVDLKAIEQSIAEKGYDTENLKATDESYNNLHSCCKYDRKP